MVVCDASSSRLASCLPRGRWSRENKRFLLSDSQSNTPVEIRSLSGKVAKLGMLVGNRIRGNRRLQEDFGEGDGAFSGSGEMVPSERHHFHGHLSVHP